MKLWTYSALILLTFSFAAPRVQAQYQDVIDAWVAQDARNPPADDSILFVGSSSIRFWESLSKDFSDYNLIQRGFGSARIPFLIQYVEDIVLPYDPAAIVMFSSPPDVATNEEGLSLYKDFFGLVHAGQRQDRPPIPIYFVGQYPRPLFWTTRWPQDEQRNSLVAEYAATNDAIHYIDTASRILESSPAPGEPPAEHLFAADMRHLSQEGYAVWHNAISDTLRTEIPPNKSFQPNPIHPSLGERILFDFGLPSRPTASPDKNGNHWNNWHPDTGTAEILAGQSIGNLITTEGQETGIDLIITGEFEANGPGLLGPNADFLSDFAVQSATRDSFNRPFFAPGAGAESGKGTLSAGFMLNGLDPTAEYDFRFFASALSRLEQSTRYSLDGDGEPKVGVLRTSESDATTNQNTDMTLLITGVKPDEFGQVFVDLQPINNDDTYIGIMEIKVVPEPATFLLAVVGGPLLCFMLRRLRR